MEEPERLYESLEAYYTEYEQCNNAMWSNKLGLKEFESDGELIQELTENLQLVETDMTIFFRLLSSLNEPSIEHLRYAFYDEETIPLIEWNNWLNKWWERVDGQPDRDYAFINPKYVIRNWMAQLAIDAAEKEIIPLRRTA